jgi:predicted AAA+ superfamily ATPase
MAVSNYDRLTKALELLTSGLVPFIERELKSTHNQSWFEETKRTLNPQQAELLGSADKPQWDAASALITMWNQWNDVFKQTLGPADRSLVSELREVRNKWAHQRTFSTDDVYRALDSVHRLLNAVSAAKEAGEIDTIKQELLRQRFDEQARNEKRKSSSTSIEGQPVAGVKPWREVVTPHKDVASGRYQQAEFAADLWQVAFVNDATVAAEYKHPVEFFRRTFLTHSLSDLLVGAVRRLTGQGGDPVIQLQTNFGGGKTHSMLALYHLFSGMKPAEMVGLESVFQQIGTDKLPAVKRVVLVGNKISPGNPTKKPDGTIVRTLWGELAWQLGGKEAFEQIRADDEKATSPGDRLRLLFNQYGPCLILIDEWVAYARQLHDQSDLPGGSFETHFTFAQTITETAKTANHTLLVVSLPASDTGGSPHTQADDIEVGGERGRAALDRLRNAIGRVESSWRPASAEEGFEIVRRRLFEPIVQQDQFVARDATARAFFDLYRTQHQEFPPECRDGDYEKRLRAAYPIHPEVFDRLYNDWSTLVKFQRTRGVLRLMAAVIHALWEKGDKNPVILPAHIPIDEPRVQFELTRYLSDNWTPVIEKDVDGPNSLPLRIDGEQPNLGKYSACRRVARTIYLGSAPTAQAANKGLEDRRVKLGCVLPGESAAIFGDALRRLSSSATYLYQDGARYWYSTQPTVTKLAEDRAEQLKNNSDAVAEEIKRRVREDVKRQKGDFSRVHDFPGSNADVPDDLDARLVILGVDHPYTKDADSAALVAAKEMLEKRGSSPRLCKNTLVFLAVDKARLADLDEAARRYLAWQSIVDEAKTLDLTPHQGKQAETQRDNADNAVKARLPESYQWLLSPQQLTPQDAVSWNAHRLTGQEPLAVRASKKLRNEEALLTKFAATRLRHELDKVPLWRGQHVEIKLLTEDFSRYLYLPRLRDTAVLIEAIRDGLSFTTWDKETFAFAESYDEKAKRYAGLRGGQHINVPDDGLFGMLVKPDIAAAQILAATPPTPTPAVPSGGGVGSPTPTPPQPGGSNPAPSGGQPAKPKRFYATVKIDATRMDRDVGQISREVVQHLVGQLMSDVEVTIEIQATVPDGFPEKTVRTISENCRTLKFTQHDFAPE